MRVCMYVCMYGRIRCRVCVFLSVCGRVCVFMSVCVHLEIAFGLHSMH